MQDSDTPEKRRAFTVAEAAKLLGVHPVSVYRRLYSGEIKVLSGFGRLTIPEAEIEKFLNRTVAYTPRKRKRAKPVAEATV
jgi:excisionase family DNA binding protein